MLRNVKVAVCGNLPTTCERLKSEGLVHIDNYGDATEICGETFYHLILVYAPQGEGLLNTAYSYRSRVSGEWRSVPVRMLNEPCCHSALLELLSTVKAIARGQPPLG